MKPLLERIVAARYCVGCGLCAALAEPGAIEMAEAADGFLVPRRLKPGADPKAKVGQRVFFDMKPNGANSWAGSAFNPEDGKTYTGKMTLDGNKLTTSGCVMSVICKSTTWTGSN